MAWYYQDKLMRAGRVWTDSEGRKYPPQWYGRSTDAEKEAKGWTWVDDPAPFDSRFYWGRDADGDLIEKNINDVNEVWSQDQIDTGSAPEGTSAGDPMLDSDGNQIITRGLKWNAVQLIKQQANGKLASSDWKVVKAAEVADYTVDAETLTYRAAVRTASNTIETAINACTTLEQFMALYVTPTDENDVPTGNAPINDWPEE